MQEPNLADLVPVDNVWQRLARVERRLREATISSDPFLTDVAQHYLRAGGKRYRPLLAQVAAEFGPSPNGAGEQYIPAVEAGVAVELVHVGSLYHDDVIDESEYRRGAISVNANWSNTVAILGGDYLLAKASEIAAPLGEDAVKLIARTYATLCEGQVAELQLEDDLEHGPDEYYTVIGGKTASLIRTSVRLGAMASGAEPEIIEALSDWAWEMGLVFQLTDDVLDLVATEDYLGKPAGSDISEGVFTLPVLHALTGPDSTRIRDLLASGQPYPQSHIDEVIDIVVTGGYVDQVLDEATERLRVAEKAAARLPAGEMTETLRRLGDFLLGRVEQARR